VLRAGFAGRTVRNAQASDTQNFSSSIFFFFLFVRRSIPHHSNREAVVHYKSIIRSFLFISSQRKIASASHQHSKLLSSIETTSPLTMTSTSSALIEPPAELPPPPPIGNLKRQQSVQLEYELRQILDELDKFQRKVEESEDNNPAANESLSLDLERLLSRLDTFQKKLEQADEQDMQSLQGLLSQLHHKMNVGEEIASNSSGTSKRARRRKSAERQLELYRRAKARTGWNSFDSPQGIILQNVVQRKQQESKKNKSWLTTIFGGDEEIMMDPPDKEIEQMLHQQVAEDKAQVHKALRRSNEGLKETVQKLESMIKSMEERHQEEIQTYQKVVMRLQQENIQLHLKVEEFERGGGEGPDSIYPEKSSLLSFSPSSSDTPLSSSPSLRHTMSALYEMEKNRSTRSSPPVRIFM
jgi:TolA-binding protein